VRILYFIIKIYNFYHKDVMFESYIKFAKNSNNANKKFFIILIWKRLRIYSTNILLMAEHFRFLLRNNLAIDKRTFSDEDIKTVLDIFEKYTESYPNPTFTFENMDETVSRGLYIAFLGLNEHETEPIPFFKILEIDSKIGWVNPEHLETSIFYFKATKIIKDQKVS